MKKILTILSIAIDFAAVLTLTPCLAQSAEGTYRNHIILLLDNSGSMFEEGAISENLRRLVTQDLKALLFDEQLYQERSSYLSTFQFGMPRLSPDCLTNFILPIPQFSGDNMTPQDLDGLYEALRFNREYTGWMAALRLALYETHNRFQGLCESTYIFMVSDMEYSEEDQGDVIEEFRYFERIGVNNVDEARRIYYGIGELYEFSEQKSRKRMKSKEGKDYFLKVYRVAPKSSPPQVTALLEIPPIIKLDAEKDGTLSTGIKISREGEGFYKINWIAAKIQNLITREVILEKTFPINATDKGITIQLKHPSIPAKDLAMDVSCELLFSDPFYGKQLKAVKAGGLALEIPSVLPPTGAVLLTTVAAAVLIVIVVRLLFRGKGKVQILQPPDRSDQGKTITSAPISLEIGLDRRTSFPCIRYAGGEWIHPSPATKIQVEQWIYEGGRDRVAHPEEIIEMIRRMESPSIADHYPETVREIQRRPINRLGPRDIQSVIATNLKLWSKTEELEQNAPVRFPVEGSEWGDFVNWMNASIPTKEQAIQWRERLSSVSSRELIRQIMRAIPVGRLPRPVERLLQALADGMPPEVRGLPFAEDGVWELVDEPVKRVRLCRGGAGESIYYPTVIGKTKLWPYIEIDQETHVVLQPALPMVGLRLILHDVEDLGINIKINPVAAYVSMNPAGKIDRVTIEGFSQFGEIRRKPQHPQ